MWKTAFALALGAGLLAGCGTPTREGVVDSAAVRKPLKCEVEVWLVDGEAVVGQDPVHTRNCNRKVRWAAQDGMTFDGAGIAFGKDSAPPVPMDCTVAPSKTELTCKFDNKPPGSYPYLLMLKDPAGTPKQVDPSVFID